MKIRFGKLQSKFNMFGDWTKEHAFEILKECKVCTLNPLKSDDLSRLSKSGTKFFNPSDTCP